MPICRFFLRCIFIFPAEIVFIMGIVLRISIFSEHGLFCNDPLFPILATVDSGFELAIDKSLSQRAFIEVPDPGCITECQQSVE